MIAERFHPSYDITIDKQNIEGKNYDAENDIEEDEQHDEEAGGAS